VFNERVNSTWSFHDPKIIHNSVQKDGHKEFYRVQGLHDVSLKPDKKSRETLEFSRL